MFCTNCVRRFSKSNWRDGTRRDQLGREIGVSLSFATGLITNTIPCWWIFATNRSPSSETVMCLATQQSRDLVLANDRPVIMVKMDCLNICKKHRVNRRGQSDLCRRMHDNDAWRLCCAWGTRVVCSNV